MGSLLFSPGATRTPFSTIGRKKSWNGIIPGGKETGPLIEIVGLHVATVERGAGPAPEERQEPAADGPAERGGERAAPRLGGRRNRQGRGEAHVTIQSNRHSEPFHVEHIGSCGTATRWGVARGGRGVHGPFWHSHLRWVELVVARDADTLPHLAKNDLQTLSADPIRALEEVFEQEIKAMLSFNNGFLTETDHLAARNREIRSIDAPYEFNRETRLWGLRAKFAGCDPDPFLRFTFERIPALTIVQQSFVESDPIGAAMRATVAHAACHRAQCYKCKRSGCLRWNRLDAKAKSRHWRRLVCESCGSVYDIQSKNTEASLFKYLETRMYGGNKFDAYFAVQNALPEGAKQFVSLVSQEAARDGHAHDGPWTWLVYVAEVESISPSLQPKSFYLDDGTCNVYASVKARQGWGLWFKVPVFEFNAQEIAGSVLREVQTNERRRTVLRPKAETNG
jgi:hypothetical protein